MKFLKERLIKSNIQCLILSPSCHNPAAFFHFFQGMLIYKLKLRKIVQALWSEGRSSGAHCIIYYFMLIFDLDFSHI